MNTLLYNTSTTLLIISFLLIKGIQISNTWKYECCDGNQTDIVETLRLICEAIKNSHNTNNLTAFQYYQNLSTVIIDESNNLKVNMLSNCKIIESNDCFRWRECDYIDEWFCPDFTKYNCSEQEF